MSNNSGLDDALRTFVTELVAYARWTAPQHAVNMRRGRVTHPIPFFGDVLTAEALTVGVNPSADEFEPGRWPSTVTTTALADRLLGYFKTTETPPHPWFNQWSEVLALLGYSYTRNAAHIDVSPRAIATVPLRGVPDQVSFARMLEADVQWLFRLLPLCPRVRVLFVGGAASQREYLFEFLRRVAPASRFRVELGNFATEDTRRAAPRFMRLTRSSMDLPAFSTGNSPSSQNPRAMKADFERSLASLVANNFRATQSE